MSVNHNTRSGCIIEISLFDFFNMKDMLCVFIRIEAILIFI